MKYFQERWGYFKIVPNSVMAHQAGETETIREISSFFFKKNKIKTPIKR